MPIDFADMRSTARTVTVPFRPRAAKRGQDDDTAGRDLRGLAVPFDTPTRIWDWNGEFDEQFKRGAFKRTLGMRTPIMQFEHGRHPLVGSIPIAEINSLDEEKEGLKVRATIFDNWLTEPLQDAIRSQAISGMSIMFRPVHFEVEERDEDVPLVTVTEAELLELGPVVWPAYESTTVDLRTIDLADLANPSTQRQLAEALLASVALPVSDGGPAEPTPTSPGSPAHLVRRRLADAKVRLLEMTQ